MAAEIEGSMRKELHLDEPDSPDLAYDWKELVPNWLVIAKVNYLMRKEKTGNSWARDLKRSISFRVWMIERKENKLSSYWGVSIFC